MIEFHPFSPFVPSNSETLILGSFPGKESTQQQRKNDWFYCANRNQFWKIFEIVFQADLYTIESKQKLFADQRIAITDIISSCERMNNKNSDDNLVNKTYNFKSIEQILANCPISRILFTSKKVYLEYLANFQKPANVELIVLPSPSPIYRRLSLQTKSEEYSKLLKCEVVTSPSISIKSC